jgi:DNA replication protein DnaC
MAEQISLAQALNRVVVPIGRQSQPNAPDPASAKPCRICQGFGYVRREVPYGHPDFGRAIECDCELIQHRRVAACDAVTSFGSALESCTFRSWKPRKGAEAAFLAAVDFALHPSGWLVLMGNPGNGKTHLAAAIRNELRANDAPVAFVNWPEFLDYLRQAFDPNKARGDNYAARFDTVAKASVLILDDVGAARLTEWVEEQLYRLLDMRTVNNMPTVITTNCNPEELGHERIVSRLLNRRIANIVVNAAQDFRRGL